MTSLLLRKLRTTVLRTQAVVTACKLALLFALTAGTAIAQQPARTPAASGKVYNFQKPANSQIPVSRTGMVAAQPDILQVSMQDDKEPKVDPKTKTPPEDMEKLDRAKYIRLPDADIIFAFPNDEQLERMILDRLRQDAGKDAFAKYPKDLRFPVNPPVGGGMAYVPKTPTYPPVRVEYDSLYIVHRRLHFEEKNSERYGWDLGIIQPFVSTAFFYKDVLLLPNSLMAGFSYGFWDSNAGKCLPGSPTPYMLYPPGLTLTGTAFEGVVITGAAFLFP